MLFIRRRKRPNSDQVFLLHIIIAWQRLIHLCTYIYALVLDLCMLTKNSQQLTRYICACVHVHINVYVYTYEHAPDAESICVYVLPTPHTVICACTCVYVSVCVCVCVCMFVCMYVCIHPYGNMCICGFV